MSLSAGLLLLFFNGDVYKEEYGCQGINSSDYATSTTGGQPRSTQIALAIYQLMFALIAEVRNSKNKKENSSNSAKKKCAELQRQKRQKRRPIFLLSSDEISHK